MKKFILPALLFVCSISFSQSFDSLFITKNARWESSNPSVTGYNDIWGYEENGREYAIIGSNWGTHFVDITNPAIPTLVSEFAGRSTNVVWRDFKTYQHYCYGVADGSTNSLQIFDLQYLPDSVVKVYDDNTLSQSAHNIFIENAKAYLASNNRGGSRQMEVLTLANPTSPQRIHTFNSGGLFNSLHDVFVRNDTAYISGGSGGSANGGQHIYDYTDSTAPVIISSISSYPGKGYNHSSWTTEDGNWLVFADETHNSPLKLYNIEDKSNPALGSTFRSNAGAIAHNPFIRNDTIFISYYHDGTQIYKLNRADSSVSLIGYYDTYPDNPGNYTGFEGCWGTYPFLPSGRFISSDRKYGLFILEFDSQQPQPVAGFQVTEQYGCGPYIIKANDTSSFALAKKWLLKRSGQVIDSAFSNQISFSVPDTGLYSLELRVSNSAGSDLAQSIVAVEGTSIIAPPYLNDFESGVQNYCYDYSANSSIALDSSLQSNNTVLKFGGGSYTAYAGAGSCPAYFFNNRSFVSLAEWEVNSSAPTLNLSFQATHYSSTIFNPGDIQFRIDINDSIINCYQSVDSLSGIKQNFTYVLTPYIGGFNTSKVRIEALVRADVPQFNVVDHLTLDSVQFSTGLIVSNESAFNLEKSKISVFPNPAKDFLNLVGVEGTKELNIMVYDARGRLVQQLENFNKRSLNVRGLERGVYQILLEYGGKLQRHTFIKK